MSRNDIRVCDKCRFTKLSRIVPALEQMAPGTTVKVGCKSYCGPCRKGAFIFINGRYVTAPTEDEALQKVRRFVKK
ncbi:DUF1450 domain-containing protein [Paenibacillus senegalensis]|uniref:DUF1450 domain-containing protein n=1 Tax=Paenibacillus senegalensis TaxID=1465766 RepID=UPI000289F232|nr:DUF1450 domain-containing protein [Paenibacillus senegalensis]